MSVTRLLSLLLAVLLTLGTAAPAFSQTSPAAATPTPAATLKFGDKGTRVRQLQVRLRALGYWAGPVDGVFGTSTSQAVYAFQKAQYLKPTGVYNPTTRAKLKRPAAVSHRSTSGLVVEIHKRRQILMVVRNGDIEWIFNTSTGTEKPYTYKGRRYLADTPPGKWRITRQVNGWRNGELGRLYRPKYFHPDGIAVHGYASVPPYPASHGCARVSMKAMDYLWNRLPIGTRVWVY